MGLEIEVGLEVIGDLPLLYLRQYRTILAADLHLGFEEEASEQGYYIPRVQYLRAIQLLSTALDLVDADRIVFAGDVKHCFSRLLRSEREEVSKLLSNLQQKGVEVVIVRGNHDNFLPIVARKYGVPILDEYRLGSILIIHGHRKPENIDDKIKVIIMGHEHPSIRIKDKLGFITRLPCFLKAPYKGKILIVLPAIGVYQTGTTVSLSPSTYLSPLLREGVDLRKVKPYVLAEEVGVLEFPELGVLNELLEEITL